MANEKLKDETLFHGSSGLWAVDHLRTILSRASQGETIAYYRASNVQ
jgi:hypothetical protein